MDGQNKNVKMLFFQIFKLFFMKILKITVLVLPNYLPCVREINFISFLKENFKISVDTQKDVILSRDLTENFNHEILLSLPIIISEKVNYPFIIKRKGKSH